MARLIDANALPVQEFLVVEDIYGNIGRYMVVHKAALDAAPTIEAEPVRRGRWINDTFCSECNRFPVDVSFNVSNQKLAKYFSWCPHCGAKMDGGEDDDKR